MDLTHAGARSGEKRRVNVGRQERNASLVGGAALALSGLRKIIKGGYLPGMALIAAGGMFLYRGQGCVRPTVRIVRASKHVVGLALVAIQVNDR